MSKSKELLDLQNLHKNEELDWKYHEDLFQEMCQWLELMDSSFLYVHMDDDCRYFISNEFGKSYLPERFQKHELHNLLV